MDFKGAHGLGRIPGKDPGAPSHTRGCWGPGVGFRRGPPQHQGPGRSCGGGGCPAPIRRMGVRCRSVAMTAPPPVGKAGLTAISLSCGEGNGL